MTTTNKEVQYWTLQEEMRLLDEMKQGLSVEAVAGIHGRSVHAITLRLKKLVRPMALKGDKSQQEVYEETGIPLSIIDAVIEYDRKVKEAPPKPRGGRGAAATSPAADGRIAVAEAKASQALAELELLKAQYAAVLERLGLLEQSVLGTI